MTSERDAQLDEVLIGGREQRSIVIVEYDTAWPMQFEQLAIQIRTAIGDTALAIEHIGSTSVPLLAAKPVIDVLLVVASVEDEATYVPQLESAGFVLRVREPGHRLFRTPAKDVHIHVFDPETQQGTDYVDLRDWLRVSEADRELYATTKKRLAQQEWSDMNYYSDAKTPVILQILNRAREWRASFPV